MCVAKTSNADAVQMLWYLLTAFLLYRRKCMMVQKLAILSNDGI